MPALPLDYMVAALVTLLVVVDPIGLAPTFLGITAGLPRATRRQVALRACLIALAILAGAALGGDWLLRTLSISLPAFRIAGGLLLFSIASEMAFGVRIARQSEAAGKALEEHARNIAAFPLAIPLMAGPGAITAMVLLAGRMNGDWRGLSLLMVILARYRFMRLLPVAWVLYGILAAYVALISYEFGMLKGPVDLPIL